MRKWLVIKNRHLRYMKDELKRDTEMDAYVWLNYRTLWPKEEYFNILEYGNRSGEV